MGTHPCHGTVPISHIAILKLMRREHVCFHRTSETPVRFPELYNIKHPSVRFALSRAVPGDFMIPICTTNLKCTSTYSAV
jgi:hypothetical protein